MKKTILILTLIFGLSNTYAQDESFPQNEVKLNIANTMIMASVELGYERFIGFNQSVEAEVLINDRINYHSEKGSRKFNTNSFKLGYNFYFGKEAAGSGLYVNPLLKYRFGDFEEEKEIEVDGSTVKSQVETDMNVFMIGIGAGYKWNFNDTFVFGPYANIARNFSDEVKERFSSIEFNAGISVGYRF